MNEKNHDFVQNRQMSEDSPFAYAELGELRKHFTEEQIEFMKAPASVASFTADSTINQNNAEFGANEASDGRTNAPINDSINAPINDSINAPINDSINDSTSGSINAPTNAPTNAPINDSASAPINDSVSASADEKILVSLKKFLKLQKESAHTDTDSAAFLFPGLSKEIPYSESKKALAEHVAEVKKETRENKTSKTLKHSEKKVPLPTVVRNGRKVRVKPKKLIRQLWNLFLEKYEPEFQKYMGYGKEEIKKIGVATFFDFWDWTNEEEMSRYKEDILKVVVCPECGRHFSVFPSEYGICAQCLKKYDVKRLEAYLSTLSDEGKILDMLTLFAFDKEVRSTFLKENPVFPVSNDLNRKDDSHGFEKDKP